MPDFTLTIQGRKPLQGSLEPESVIPPQPVEAPTLGLFLEAWDGQQVVRVLDDMHSPRWNYHSRTVEDLKIKILMALGKFIARLLPKAKAIQQIVTNLAITNMTLPFWCIENGVVGTYKTICRLDLEPAWIDFLEWLNGPRNLEWLVQPGTGYADTDDPDTDPHKDPVKWQSLDWGNNTRLVVPNANISARFTQVKVFDYFNPPSYDEGSDQWLLDGKPVGIDATPELMVVQTLVGNTPEGVSYGPVADKGFPGGAGRVITPAVMRFPAIHETQDLFFYLKPPFRARIYPSSLMVDGKPANAGPGMEVIVDRMCFTGFKIFGWVGEDCYLLEEMLMRGDINDRSLGGTWKDWRIYCDYGGHMPPCCPPQDIGWVREVL